MSENLVYADLNLTESTKPVLVKITDVQASLPNILQECCGAPKHQKGQRKCEVQCCQKCTGSTYAEVKVQSPDTNAADSYTSSGKSRCSRTCVAASVAVIILLLVLAVCLILTLTPGLVLAKETSRKPPQWSGENNENHTGCPQRWVKHGRKCYFFSPVAKLTSWNTSREECRNMSSDLVIIDNKEELNYLLSRSEGHYYLLGLTYSQLEKKWKWINNAEYNMSMFTIRGNFSDYLCTVIGHCEVQSASCHGSSTTLNMCEKAANI